MGGPFVELGLIKKMNKVMDRRRMRRKKRFKISPVASVVRFMVVLVLVLVLIGSIELQFTVEYIEGGGTLVLHDCIVLLDWLWCIIS